MVKKRILVDFDEVLADFYHPACEIHGVDPAELEAKRQPSVWSMQEVMGISETDFWAPIEATQGAFWISLPKLPWFDELISVVDKFEWHIISAPYPDASPCFYDGRVKWFKNEFGSKFDRFCLTPHKYLMAKASHILIDDREQNCREFTLEGGRSLLFPSRGNRLAKFAHNPLRQVRDYHALQVPQRK